MKKTLQQALRRLRKAQDAIINNKLTEVPDPTLEVSTHGRELVGHSYVYFYAHIHFCKGKGECHGGHFTEEDNQEHIDDVLKKLSQFLKYEV